MKIYRDKDLKEEVKDVLDLGIVPAGEVKKETYWLYNDSTALLKEISISLNHDEVKILEYPKELSAYAIGEFIVEWSPTVTLKQGLSVDLEITAKEIY